MRKTALIYARVSTAKQAAEELPVTSQIEQCRAKAAALGADVLQVFADRGISGTDEDRPGFQDAIAYAEAERIDYFVTWSTSRFSRDSVHAAVYKRRLEKAGVELAYCTVDIDRDTTAGFILDNVLSMIDEVYSRQVSIDTLRSLMNNARAGNWNGGRMPYGYKAVESPRDARRRTLVPAPEEAWLVQCIFRWRCEGSGPLQIAAALNDQGHSHRGARWNSTAVSNILASPAVLGVIVFNRRPSRRNPGRARLSQGQIEVQSFEPIITREQWDQVQEVKRRSARRKSGSPMSTHLLTGLLTCGHCGARMHVETAMNRHGTRYAYYNCHAWLSARACGDRRRRADALDGWLLEAITTRVFTREVMLEVAQELNGACGKWASERKQQMAGLDRELADATKRKRKLMEVLELHGIDAPNLGEIGPRITELRARETELREKIEGLRAQALPRFDLNDADLEALRESLMEIVSDRSDVKRSRAMLQQVLESVVLHSETAEINYKTALLSEPTTQVVGVHSTKSWLLDQDSNLGPSD